MENEIKDCCECAKKCENCEFVKFHENQMKNEKKTGINYWMLLALLLFVVNILSFHVYNSSMYNSSFRDGLTFSLNGRNVTIDDATIMEYIKENRVLDDDEIKKMLDEYFDYGFVNDIVLYGK